jgi:hypothetical protein
MGGWILNADPRAIISAGRWTLALLPALALAALAWLIASGRWTAAVLLAAFLLPVFVQAAPRWRVLLGPLNVGRGYPDFAASRGGGIVPGNFATMRRQTDAAPVQQSIAVSPTDMHLVGGPVNGSESRSTRMSTEEALEVLGLRPTAEEIREAHRRLEQKVSPQFGGTQYLSTKIDEARDVLLRE